MDLAKFSITQWFILAVIIYIMATFTRLSKKDYQFGCKKVDGLTKIVVVLILVILSLLAANRTGIGDTATYVLQFNRVTVNTKEFFETLKYDGEWGFKVVNFVIKKVFGSNETIFLFVFSFMIIGGIFVFFLQESDNIELCIIVYFLGGSLVTGLNGMRQALVASFFVLSSKLITKKKIVPYIIICLALSTVHKSALFLLPVFFVLRMKAWKKGSYILFAVAILMYVAYPVFGNILTDFLEGSTYEGYSEGIVNFKDGGANILRAGVYIVPVLLSFVFRKKLESEKPNLGILVNATILNFMFMLLASVKSWIFARFCIYFTPFSIILLDWCIQVSGKYKKLLYPACLFFYSIFFYYEMMSFIV